MQTLKEYPVYQQKGEPRRRWFTDDFFDIFVWLNKDSTIMGFQLCYDKMMRERALTWVKGRGFRHDLIDDGEASPTKNRSPILVSDGDFPANEVLVLFITSSGGIEERIRVFIIDMLCHYGNLPALDATGASATAPTYSPASPPATRTYRASASPC